MLNNVGNSYLSSFVVENAIYNINRVFLQELGMTYGEGFLIMINYIFNQIYNLQV